MGKQRVQLHQSTSGVAIETAATVGAVLGVNLILPDGTVVTEEMLGIGVEPPPEEEYPFTYWRLIMEIPPNVVALAETSTTGLYAITGAGTSVTRAIQGTIGRTTVSNGDGVAGPPVVDLAAVPDSGVGAGLYKITVDAWGRVTGKELYDTSDLNKITVPSSGGALSALRAVALEDGEARYPDNDLSSDAELVVGVTVTAGTTVDVVTIGEVTDVSWSWAPGIVWCGDDGVLTQAPPSGWLLEVGRAIDATRLFVAIKTPFLRN